MGVVVVGCCALCCRFQRDGSIIFGLLAGLETNVGGECGHLVFNSISIPFSFLSPSFLDEFGHD